MKRMLPFVFLLFLPFAGSTQDWNLAPPTVGGLASECRAIHLLEAGSRLTERQRIGLHFCLGFIAGASEAAAALDGHIDCAPAGVNAGQRAKILVKWADEDPGALHLPRASGLALAMMKTFPCG